MIIRLFLTSTCAAENSSENSNSPKVVYTTLLSLKFSLIVSLSIMSETLPDRATAKSLMTSRLPQYLCNCLLLCVFDTLEVI